jgi:hypothetical protein
MTFVIDIDDTITASLAMKCAICGRYRYTYLSHNEKIVKQINDAYNAGNRIIIHTGRGWDIYDDTVVLLDHIGVKYHQLVMGKPVGKYIDADAKTSMDGWETW